MVALNEARFNLVVKSERPQAMRELSKYMSEEIRAILIVIVPKYHCIELLPLKGMYDVNKCTDDPI